MNCYPNSNSNPYSCSGARCQARENEIGSSCGSNLWGCLLNLIIMLIVLQFLGQLLGHGSCEGCC
ncbi:MAG: hypothetical protein Q4B50_08205 [Bacillota bacterium]|nr:hypothetical protein [Bacillota bacterium]